ncbi:hypothetical protein F2Q69_00059291 [Brassica cretica]|uniref:Leucine-rich repeat-containing N-terminal plant-type domain-containing protein n=1 Tax=Brassica cretica TaxID=69181 RepID=A0A8S9RQM8_BRACR|nr:hypothetical protein F2Q69_00059291 [Brassica cretica]
MALVLFMIVTLMLQLQMKGCVGCLETERMGLLQLKTYLKNGFKVEEESMLKSWSHDDPSSDCCHWKRLPSTPNLKLSFNKFSDLFDPINVLTGLPMLQELDRSNNGHRLRQAR